MGQQNGKKNFKHNKKKPVWPLILLLGAGVLLIVGAIFALKKPGTSRAEVEVSGAPSLKVDQQKVDLGDVKLGKTVEVTFQLTNVGDQTLKFTKTPYIEVIQGC